MEFSEIQYRRSLQEAVQQAEFRENRVIKGSNKFLSVICSDCVCRKIRLSENKALARGIKE